MNSVILPKSISQYHETIYIDLPSSLIELTIQNISYQNFFFLQIHSDSNGIPIVCEIITFQYHFIIDIMKFAGIYRLYCLNSYSNQEVINLLNLFLIYFDKIIRSQKIIKISNNNINVHNLLNIAFPHYFKNSSNVITIESFFNENKELENYNLYQTELKKPFKYDESRENVNCYLNILSLYKDVKIKKNYIFDNILLDLKKDLNFNGNIILINEKNANIIEKIPEKIKEKSIVAIDYLTCPRDKVIDILFVALDDLIYIIDIKSIKKAIFNETRKKIKNIQMELIKINFIKSINDLLIDEKTLKITYNFNPGMESLKNRFNNDIYKINNILDLEKFKFIFLNNNDLNPNYNDFLFSIYDKFLSFELNDFDMRSNIFSPITIYLFCTKAYSLLRLYEKKIELMPFISENLNIVNNIKNSKSIKKKKKSNENENIGNLMFFPFFSLNDSPSYVQITDYIEFKDWGFNEENIYIIDNLDDKFNEAVLKIMKSNVIGIDSEWHPSTNSTSIIQIATEKEIFIFDVYLYNKNNKKKDNEIDNLFYKGIAKILDSNNIVKVCFDFGCDRKNLQKINRTLFQKEWNIIDFKDYKENILGTNKGGLRDLVIKLFEKDLCKSMQISNWNKRPLLEEQIKYAALDAYIVLQIYLYLNSFQ